MRQAALAAAVIALAAGPAAAQIVSTTRMHPYPPIVGYVAVGGAGFRGWRSGRGWVGGVIEGG